jgi:L1 cell adhesion molecule like protein
MTDSWFPIKKFRDPPPFLVARLITELHLASKLQTKDVEALCDNKYIIKILGYGHEIIWENMFLQTHIFVVQEYMSNGNMVNTIYGIFPSEPTFFFCESLNLHTIHYILK